MIFKNINKIKTFLLIIIILPYLNSCGIYRKVDAKEYPPEPEKRIKKNMEEDRKTSSRRKTSCVIGGEKRRYTG